MKLKEDVATDNSVVVSLLKTAIVYIDFGILRDYCALELHPRSGMLKTAKEPTF
jgi:hypothetical protein